MKKWMKIVLLIVFMIVVMLGCTPAPQQPTPQSVDDLPGDVAGYYRPSTGAIVCFDKAVCLHEIGHKVDHEIGWYSDSEEWEDKATYWKDNLFVSTGNPDHPIDRIRYFPGLWDNPSAEGGWGGYRELYADILSKSQGLPEGMPEIFRDCYDWERIWELQKEYSMDGEWPHAFMGDE